MPDSHRWEYKFVTFSLGKVENDYEEAEAALNSLGDDGWEAVSVLSGMGADVYGVRLF